jgi:hypothetical protein
MINARTTVTYAPADWCNFAPVSIVGHFTLPRVNGDNSIQMLDCDNLVTLVWLDRDLLATGG